MCYAVYAGEGDPRENQVRFLEEFNEKHRTQGSEPEDMAAIAADLRGHEAYVLIENSTKTYETYWVLMNLGVRVVVAQAQDLYRITMSVKKTDKNDSVELAAYMRRYLAGEREFAVCTMPPFEWMMRREVCRVLFAEKRHLGDLKRRVKSHLLLHGIRLSREYRDIFSKKAVAELKATKDPCLLIMVSEAAAIKSRTAEEGQLISQMFGGNRMYGLIMSIPGFGMVSAAYLMSMVMDIDRFPSRKAFAAYFGVVPKMRESADTTHNCATTHRGDAEVRRLLMQAAFVHVNTVEDSVVKRMWNRLRPRKAFREVQVACARKLLTVVYSVVRSRQPYVEDPDRLSEAREKAEEMLEEDTEEE